MDEADIGVATAALANNLHMDSIFGLVKVRVEKLLVRRVASSMVVRPRLLPNAKSWTSARQKGVGGMAHAGVLAGLQEEVEGNGDHVHNGGIDRVSAIFGNECNMEEDGGWNGFDVVERGSCLE